ncbi:MAG: hypothetical protein F6K19_01580 [Cyanothece sp. SIO1E1]|nr:hypothetical protein [Cyanothece sp. SIO1E1]
MKFVYIIDNDIKSVFSTYEKAYRALADKTGRKYANGLEFSTDGHYDDKSTSFFINGSQITRKEYFSYLAPYRTGSYKGMQKVYYNNGRYIIRIKLDMPPKKSKQRVKKLSPEYSKRVLDNLRGKMDNGEMRGKTKVPYTYKK